MATQILGDLGADVIKFERHEGEWSRHWGIGNGRTHGEMDSFLAFNRNKRSVAVDLKDPADRERILELAADADVVVENFRPGVMARLGLAYEDFRAVNPRIIFASSSGWGQEGPYRTRPGQDLLAQAMSGVMFLTGEQTDPPRANGIGIADLYTGLHIVIGVLAAHRAGSSGSRYSAADVAAASFDDLAVLHLTGIGVAVSESLASAVDAAVARARGAGVDVSFGVNHRPHLAPDLDRLRALLSTADVAFVSLEDAEAVYGHADRARIEAELAARPGRETVLTLGAEGAIGWAGGEPFACPAPAVRTVDTAGAGDALAGTYLASRLLGRDPPAALALGVAAACLSVTGRGCALSYPDRAAVETAGRRASASPRPAA